MIDRDRGRRKIQISKRRARTERRGRKEIKERGRRGRKIYFIA